MNIQDGNVGNRGDILKHAGLVRLAGLMRRCNSGQTLNYLDTHAYRLEGRLASPAWSRATAELCRLAHGYETYRRLEYPFVSTGTYLCSVGLVCQCLSRVHLHLSEADTATRALLSRQVQAKTVAPVVLESAVSAWAVTAAALSRRPLLALVDPFELTADTWQAARAAIARLHRAGADGLAEVFTYRRDRGGIDWPEAPGGWIGPVARLDARPYFLAVYATDAIAAAARRELTTLRWTPLS